MFNQSQQYYDLIYSFKDYKKEADLLQEFLGRIAPEACSILDVACGTGEHDRYLQDRYRVDGIDLDEKFLEIARQKNPRGCYSCFDMADFDLGIRYDIVLCLFGSIGYVKTFKNLRKTLHCFRRHLNDDGVVIVEPWLEPSAWEPRRVIVQTAENEELKICRMSRSEMDSSVSRIRMHYLLGSPDGIEHFEELHELGLFSRQEMEQAFTEAGLAVEYNPTGLTGRGFYIGQKNEER